MREDMQLDLLVGVLKHIRMEQASIIGSANQWNIEQGINGFFKISKRVDECRIESSEITFGTIYYNPNNA